MIEILEEIEDLAGNLVENEKALRNFLSYFDHKTTPSSPAEQGQPNDKRRRLMQKQSCPDGFGCIQDDSCRGSGESDYPVAYNASSCTTQRAST